MATLSMCDRCSKLGVATGVGTIVWHAGPHTETHKQELCPECIGELVAWISNAPERVSSAPFREHWTAASELPAIAAETASNDPDDDKCENCYARRFQHRSDNHTPHCGHFIERKK